MIRIDRPRTSLALSMTLALTAILSGAAAEAAAGAARAEPHASALHPVDEFSPAMLGVYRKVMNIEADIIKYAARYGVDVALARAVCMYESGGNVSLTSSAGARGYFQVMPRTFRLMRVKSNIEAGIKYLGQMVKQFGREDYALAAYNGGPGRVARGRGMPLESLQYVLGVGTYRSALNAYEPSIRAHAADLQETTVRKGDAWWTLAERVGLPVVQLRLHNPFLAARSLRPGATVVYPRQPRTGLFDPDDPSHYVARIGDNYLKVAYALGVNVSLMREANDLWRLQPTLPGVPLTIPRDPDTTFVEYTVPAPDSVSRLAARVDTDPWWIVRDNYAWNEELSAGTVLRLRTGKVAKAAPTIRYHTVKARETLSRIARRYATTVRAIQAANGLGRRTLVRIGQRLRIPAK